MLCESLTKCRWWQHCHCACRVNSVGRYSYIREGPHIFLNRALLTLNPALPGWTINRLLVKYVDTRWWHTVGHLPGGRQRLCQILSRSNDSVESQRIHVVFADDLLTPEHGHAAHAGLHGTGETRCIGRIIHVGGEQWGVCVNAVEQLRYAPPMNIIATIYLFIYFNSIAGSKPMEYNDKKPSNIYIKHTKNTVTPTVRKREIS